MKTILVLVAALLFSFVAMSQAPRSGAPNVFVDCQYYCDLNYLKTELGYLNFMRDRADADIFVQQVGIATGGGGTQFSLYFYGQKMFAGKNDTLTFNVPPAAGDNALREALKANLERGLLPYLLKSPLADRINFSVKTESAGDTAKAVVKDPWNYWTFSVDATIDANGQQVAKSFGFYGGLSANRVTERLKTNVRFNSNYEKSTFQFDDETEPEIYENRSYYLNASHVIAINQHWSYGFFAGSSQTQFRNIRQSIYLNPGIEYNVFPYKEATKRNLSFQYRIGALHNEYFDTTIFFKKRELLGLHNVNIGYNQVVKWGSFNIGGGYSNYLHDWSLYEVNIFGGFELNLFKGFRLNLFGNFSVPHNQIELPSDGASQQEAYLRIRQLKTNFNYFTYCGISYTFGSIYSNVVNPRFGNGQF